MGMRVIIFGATGMVGEGVLHECLSDDTVEAILVVGRRSCDVHHPKVRELILQDFFDYSSIEEQLRGYSACFFCLGVTSIGKNEGEYTRLTHDLTIAAATVLARLNSEMTFCYVSGTGTDSTEQGRVMWARVKGKTENDISTLPFKAAYHFRPGFIKPTVGLKNAYGISKALGLIYPVLRIIFPGYVCTLHDLGVSMIRAAGSGYSRRVLENRDIAFLAHP